jgi:hypothetical protein
MVIQQMDLLNLLNFMLFANGWWPILWSNFYIIFAIFLQDIIGIFENTIDKNHFMRTVEFSGGGEFRKKITCFNELIVERIGDVGNK